MQVKAPNKNSIRALAYEIHGVYYSSKPSDDSRLSLSQIEQFCRREASAIIKELVLRDKLLGIKPDDNLYVPYFCLDTSESCDFTCDCTDDGGSFKVVQLPNILYINGKPQISYFGSTDLDLPYTQVNSIQQANRLSKGVIGLKNSPLYFIAKNKAYIVLPKGYELMDKVSILAIPQDGGITDSSDCNDIWSTDWSLPNDIKALVFDSCLKKLLPSYANYTPNKDYRNNNNDGAQVSSLYKQSNQV